MLKKMFLPFLLVMLFPLATSLPLEASTKAWLTPKPPAGPSDAIPLREGEPDHPGALGVDYMIYYDTGAGASYLGGLSNGDTLLVWFQPPASCTLLQIHIEVFSAGYFDMFAADAPDVIDWKNDYEEYHGGSNPGPRPIETVFNDSVGVYSYGHDWQVLEVVSRPDVGTDVFVGGYVLRDDGMPQPIIDPGISEPPEGYHTLMERQVPGGPRGWYSSWHHVYIRALVNLYENVYPTISPFAKLPDTYSLTSRYITAHITDVGIPPESAGIADARILRTVNSGAEDTFLMFLVSGTIEDGDWAGFLPPAAAGDTVTYSLSAVDRQGAESITTPWEYIIRAGQPTAEVLFIDDDYYAANGYDPVANVVPDSLCDFWFSWAYGLPDSSVIHFGYKAILWNTWDGTGDFGFVADTLRIAEFLNEGGYLFLSSQDLPAGGFGYSWGAYTTQPGEFCYDYLHLMGGVDDWGNDTISIYYGVSGDPITDDFSVWPVTSYPYGWAGPGYNYAGCCEIDTNDLNASPIFFDLASAISGYKYNLPGAHKIVYLYWPFNDLVNGDGSPDSVSQDILVTNVMRWFGIGTVGVEELRERAEPESRVLLLWQNSPNPMTKRTRISFNLPEPGRASLRIHDVAGRVVRVLLDGPLNAGRHTAHWDGHDSSGAGVPSGVYICKLSVGGDVRTKKMVLVR